MVITFTSDSPVGALVDALTQSRDFLPNCPLVERQRIENDLRTQQKLFDDTARAAKQAATSEELTAKGQREAVKRALLGAASQLKVHQETAKRLQDVAADIRAKALHPKIERTADVLMQEREIRDRLVATGLDSLSVAPLYLRAIEQGDWVFVSAIENAPRAFPLLNADMLEMGTHTKLAVSPLAAELAEQEAIADLYGSTAATVRTELTRLADAHMVSREDIGLA